ncbi:TIGR00730 family Rossman fold protein [Nostoc sp. FACHB-152]|uniref:LOG family protein n=1 Tax=unclassified Nostoc TaxID=2593658 RepID=UPI001684FF2F|nr:MULTISPECIES: TIGR00730 family Rossman fold protein [unclassified Nostoc]MBD2446720.1 TIGR00730 family Rossman fold protein [Nostoc sp. FACHB-152]MBD2466568.1 TIGR00730 family Rossman fold protein [Nostoc sp. FACHB-145]
MKPPAFNICVFCGSKFGANSMYESVARTLGMSMAQQQIGLVYGGASIGLMGAVSSGCLQAGGYVAGVLPEVLIPYEIAHPELSSLTITKTMHDRKAIMYKLSDAFIALPGGVGTLDELFEIITWAHLDIHKKPIALLNIAGFFNPLLTYLDHTVKEGFVSEKLRELVSVYDDVELMLEKLVKQFSEVESSELSLTSKQSTDEYSLLVEELKSIK